MIRAVLVSLGLCLVIMWLVGLVDGSTDWLTWLDGIAALLAFGNAALITEDTGPIASAAGPALIGSGLMAMFIVGLATSASSWLVWFTFAMAGGFLSVAAFAFALKAFEPRLYSRRPISVQ